MGTGSPRYGGGPLHGDRVTKVWGRATPWGQGHQGMGEGHSMGTGSPRYGGGPLHGDTPQYLVRMACQNHACAYACTMKFVVRPALSNVTTIIISDVRLITNCDTQKHACMGRVFFRGGVGGIRPPP